MTGFSHSLNHAFIENGLKPPDFEEVRSWVGPPLHMTLKKFILPEDQHLLSAVLESYRSHHANFGIFEYRPYENVFATLGKLQKIHRLFTATSKPLALALPLLKHFGFDQFFESLYGSELSGERSDKTELIEHILQTENLEPSQTVMVGDRKFDVIGAKANKIAVIGVTWGFGSPEELEEAGADFIVGTWEDLCSRLDKLNSF